MQGEFDQRQVTIIRSQQPIMSWIDVVKGQKQMGGTNASLETEIIKRVKRSEDQFRDELVEGIPNEVTLICIAAKLPYRAWQIAASLSPDWRRAFEGGMVYDARVRSQATETFVAVLCSFSQWYRKCLMKKQTLSLFSPNDERWYKLPRIPGFPGGMPINTYCQIAALDSSIYVLGGTRSGEDSPIAKVFVLDLAIPPLEWKRCADMQIQRRDFRVGVLHGKIFVFGGLYDCFTQICSNEVYDPKLDAWSWIAPIKTPAGSDKYYAITQAWSVGQQFVCKALLGYLVQPSREWRPWWRPDYTPSSSVERLFVQAGARGPFLRRLSHKHRFAQDQMDGLHEMIDNQRFDTVGRLPLALDTFPLDPDTFPLETPADRLAQASESSQEPLPDFELWTYYPLKDNWGVYEIGSVDPNTVDSWDYPYPKTRLRLPLPSGDSYSQVWTMSFCISASMAQQHNHGMQQLPKCGQ